jgi:hypothetical protein
MLILSLAGKATRMSLTDKYTAGTNEMAGSNEPYCLPIIIIIIIIVINDEAPCS